MFGYFSRAMASVRNRSEHSETIIDSATSDRLPSDPRGLSRPVRPVVQFSLIQRQQYKPTNDNLKKPNFTPVINQSINQ